MNARLIVETGTAYPQLSELSPRETFRLGRNSKNDIIVEDPRASRWHAELTHDGQKWLLRDCDTTNGTKLNGVKIQQASALEENDVISIGETRLRFSCALTKELPVLDGTHKTDAEIRSASAQHDFSQTLFHADELTALLQFTTASLSRTTTHDLVALALTIVLRQTQADMAGFLSLDADEPHFRLVLPAQAQVDARLSQQLTQRVQQERQAVWLGARRPGELDSESLAGFRDAVGIPLRATGTSADPTTASDTLGALHVYRTKRLFAEREVRFCEVLAGCLAGTLHLLRARRALEADNSRLRDSAAATDGILIGASAVMKQLRHKITQFAPLPCTVLITGESGVGKELVALSLHQQSPRRQGPMVAVNCGAIPASLAESELFGHEKGAFSGADRERLGCFVRADQGTLFLDEIGDMPLAEQAKLLRVLENKSLRPVGGDDEVQVDVRILAATNRDLKSEVHEHHFRKDLFFRLGTTLHVPPLREHLEDVPALVEHFLARLSLEYRRHLSISSAALDGLRNFNWPGNVRQLRSVLETAAATMEGSVVSPRSLDRLLLEEQPTAAVEQLPTLNLEALEAQAVRQALARTAGNNTQAARLLGIHRETLHAKLKKYGIERKT